MGFHSFSLRSHYYRQRFQFYRLGSKYYLVDLLGTVLKQMAYFEWGKGGCLLLLLLFVFFCSRLLLANAGFPIPIIRELPELEML